MNEVGPGIKPFEVEVRCDGAGDINGNSRGGCGSLLLLEIADLKFHSISMSTRPDIIQVIYKCAHCKSENLLDESKYPPQPRDLKRWITPEERKSAANNSIDPY